MNPPVPVPPFLNISVGVQAGDYRYTGEVAGFITKRSGEVRAIVEDSNGRLFIHHPAQLTPRTPRRAGPGKRKVRFDPPPPS